MILAAALTASLALEIDLTALVRRAPKEPVVTCGIKTVGYRFSGKPGQEFRYGGQKWTVPAEGWIELIATKRPNYMANGRELPLDVWPLNQFGFREVPLPSPLNDQIKEN